MSSHSSTHKRAPADIITYSYNKQMVYVTPGETYDEALDFAQEVYPELRTCPRECIHFKISVSVNGSRQKVRIGSRAWGKVLANLTRYEVVEIQLEDLPPTVPAAPEKEGLTFLDSPPQYFADEKKTKERGSGSSTLRSTSSFSRLSALFRGK